MDPTYVTTPNAPSPRAPYSQGVVATGKLAFISGQGPFTPAGELITTDFASQARLTFQNVAAIAEATGGSLRTTLRVGVYLRDMANFNEMNAIYLEFFTDPLPARTTIQSNLPRFDIEVDAVVAVPD